VWAEVALLIGRILYLLVCYILENFKSFSEVSIFQNEIDTK